MRTKVYHITIIVFSFLFITGCNTTKYLKENEYLLDKNILLINNDKGKEIELNPYILQKPNNRLLKSPIGLHIYNLGTQNYDSIYLQKIEEVKNNDTFLTRFFSKKQILGFYKNKKNFNNWLINSGEAPVIVQEEKTKKTALNLKNYYFNKGYFNNEVKTNSFNNGKKTTVSYNVKTHKPFFIGDINYSIKDTTMSRLIKTQKNQFPLKKGDQFNIENLKKTLEKIKSFLRNNGYFHFNERAISFRKIDTLAKNKITPIEVVIENRKIEKDNKIEETPFKKQTIKNVNVYTDYSYSTRNQEYDIKKTYKNITFFAHQKLKHSKRILANSIFIKPGSLFNDRNVGLTRKQLKSLNNFKSIKINHKELPNNQLETNIILTPQKKYAIGLNTEVIHSNIKQIGVSGGFSFINRNLLKGAEVLKISTQGSIFDTAISDNDEDNFNAYELGIDASLEFPKIIFPFLSNIIPLTKTPKTKISVGTSFQENIGLDRQNFNGTINYNWKASRNNTHTFEPLNLQLINNLNSDSYFNIYNSEYEKIKTIQPLVDPSFNLTTANASSFINNINSSFNITNPEEYNTIQNIANREDIITSNFLIPATSYSYEHNSRRGLNDNNYNFFKTKISSSGNIASLLLNEVNGQKTYRNIAVSQFLKFDIDFRNIWRISNNNTLAIRTFIGAIFPTGKTPNIPFVTSYFAGGSNDIRAWRAYELGPGKSNSGLEFNIGQLKLLSSAEYRFKVINSIYGALFIDAGNIWDLPDSETATKEEVFNGISSLENIAIGSGLGLRYNLSFLVLRFDLAFKTYEPYLEQNKWFSNYNINSSVLNLGINYPF